MIVAIKILLILAIALVISYPFIPMKGKLRKLSVDSSLKYRAPHNKKNIFFVVLAVIEFAVLVVIFDLFGALSSFIYSVPLLGGLFSKIANSVGSQINYIIFAILVCVVNFAVVYAFIFVKAFLKKAVISPLLRIGKAKKIKSLRKKKNKKGKKDKKSSDGEKKTDNDENTEKTEEKQKTAKKRRIPSFVHLLIDNEEDDEKNEESDKDGDKKNSKKNKAKEKKEGYGPIAAAILGIFFEGDKLRYARPWVVRTTGVLQIFIRLVQIIYAAFLLLLLTSVFFELPRAVYDVLINILTVRSLYVYPTVSIIFLQEICNTFNTSDPEQSPEDKKNETEEDEEKRRDAKLHSLFAELRKRFDAEHYLRSYPEVPHADVPEYVCTHPAYAGALNHIKDIMKNTSGRVVQSYMEFLDAVYNDAHTYFAASFYSELGEYLIAYTYMRLLSGARMIFVVADADEKATLRKYISGRLMEMTGSNVAAGWRVYTSDERLDQADVLIASPEDFLDNSIIEQYRTFFEEASNAIFIDADRTVSLCNYICPIISTKLQNATDGRIRFIFLSLDLLKGFAAGSLPRFFCVNSVLSFSSARENEAVSYVLWNKESKNHRIYNKSGQKSNSLEAIIAEQACEYGIDGVRVITEAALEQAERKKLALHSVEINKLYKNAVDINYMIYSDDRCNLSAALYACTRFRGKKRSVVHILSKPYLLREYFVAKSITEDYINHSSFIQPRVTEHADRHKLSLVKIFCDSALARGLAVEEFEKRIADLIITTRERGDFVSSAYCRNIIANGDIFSLRTNDFAGYLISGLCEDDICQTEAEETAAIRTSVAVRAKDYYIIVDAVGAGGQGLLREKRMVFNREKEIFGKLLECNRRVELRLNDEVIGLLDTVPSRARLEYIEGQNIIFKNSEYEIERIAADGSAVYLRHENINIKNCLDTVLLRRYKIDSLTPVQNSAVLGNSKSALEEIRVTKCTSALEAETYGFYSLTMDRQTLDFHKGVEGSPRSEYPDVRKYSAAGALHVSLKLRRECNDGMRLLMSAAFNEFIKTLFPGSYRCISICPVLAEPVGLAESEDGTEPNPIDSIKTLYPFIESPTEQFVETDPKRMQFVFINDCAEDVGVIEWFYDRSARYMQEFLANIYSYLHWLKIRPEKQHYIYFGGDTLPECYDLEGCCEVLGDLNLLLSDDGKRDIETAGDDEIEAKTEYCSFCHKPMESGRYMFFDKNRFICSECADTVVGTRDRLDDVFEKIREYLKSQYSEINFPKAKVEFDNVYDLTSEQILSEYYYRLDFADNTVYVELDNPEVNAAVSILRGIIAFWQTDNQLSHYCSAGQLYFEEMCYLRHIGQPQIAEWVYNAVPSDVREIIDQITEYIGPAASETEEDAEEKTSAVEKLTSFSFMRMIDKKMSGEKDGEDEPLDEDYSDRLYNPNKIPRFWKRYLRGEHIDDGKEDEIPEDADENDGEIPEDGTSDEGDDLNNDGLDNSELLPNKSFDGYDDGQETAADKKESKKQAKQRKKEERKRKREEKRRQKQLKSDNLDKKDESDTDSADKTAKKSKKKKKFFKHRGKGTKEVPYELDEETNPKIRVYNDIVRAAYSYSEEGFSRVGVTDEEFDRIFWYVRCDYPELFWMDGYLISATEGYHRFRCRDANNNVDKKQITKKRNELKKAAKPFIKGIGRRTDPYKALLTIYRRLVLTLDYDGVGLNAGIGGDVRRDDSLRSLYNALVNHKVVCAGYAVALQYLLQSVGIVCGYVVSESNSSGICHAFNILKLGKYCYYIDATWGDRSDTLHNKYKNDIRYDYVCVPYNEFIMASENSKMMHCPRAEFYPKLEKFGYTNHEYYRYHNAYLDKYDESELCRIIAEAAINYDKDTMGNFTIGIRCSSVALRNHICKTILSNGRMSGILDKATEQIPKRDKKARALLSAQTYAIDDSDSISVFLIHLYP